MLAPTFLLGSSALVGSTPVAVYGIATIILNLLTFKQARILAIWIADSFSIKLLDLFILKLRQAPD